MTSAVSGSAGVSTRRIIIVIESDRSMRLHLRQILEEEFPDLDVLTAKDGLEGHGIILQHNSRVALVLTANVMRRKTGFALVNEFLRQPSRPPFILMSGAPWMESGIRSLEEAGFGFFQKPTMPQELRREELMKCVRGVLKNNGAL